MMPYGTAHMPGDYWYINEDEPSRDRLTFYREGVDEPVSTRDHVYFERHPEDRTLAIHVRPAPDTEAMLSRVLPKERWTFAARSLVRGRAVLLVDEGCESANGTGEARAVGCPGELDALGLILTASKTRVGVKEVRSALRRLQHPDATEKSRRTRNKKTKAS